MSFSATVKDELCKTNMKHAHCEKAELCGMIFSAGTLSFGRRGFSLSIISEHRSTALKALSLFRKSANIDCEFSEMIRQPKNTTVYQVRADSIDLETLATLGLSIDGGISTDEESFAKITEKECCRTAFIRGCFLGSGSVSDPKSSYHVEFVMHNTDFANVLKDLLACFDIDAGITEKKNSTVVYAKDIETLISLFSIIGAGSAVLELENIRIYKNIKNTINRQTNFDNANIEKTLDASGSQVANINLIINTIGIGKLSPELQKTALLRLENPEATLSELAALSGDTTRSGINHRLRRLNSIALSIENKGGKYDK